MFTSSAYASVITLKNKALELKTFLILIFSLVCIELFCLVPSSQKVLICGIGRNVESAAENIIKNVENLGKTFSDYRAIIYENNSSDNTVGKLSPWPLSNPRVTFLSENLEIYQQLVSRTEKIARARNKVLEEVRGINYQDYDYLIMVDLDFNYDWPIEEIHNVIKSPVEWDCVSANGIEWGNIYYDRYAFRSKVHPFGPELMGDSWWQETFRSWFYVDEKEGWIPVYSAFGGLAIYKTSSVMNCSYSGIVTEDLEKYYRKILADLPYANFHCQQYCQLKNVPPELDINSIPIVFHYNTAWESPDNSNQRPNCCEHLPLHASMALNGFGKFYINPNMIMKYAKSNPSEVSKWPSSTPYKR